MARLFADENFTFATVEQLRADGHDVVTALQVGRANLGIPDEDVLDYATANGRAVLTFNRRHFVRLHTRGVPHAGIVVCTDDRDHVRLGRHVHVAISNVADLAGQLVRVYRAP